MLDRHDAEATFLQHISWIEKVSAIACRKQGMGEAEIEDFTGWVKIRLMDDDYAVIRKFRGESEMKTFLATVVRRQLFAYSREQRGRWRPSAAAERLGPPAGELEQLVYRDHYSLGQAAEKLRTEGRTTLSDTELARLLAQLPERQPLRPVEVASDVLLDGAAGAFRADEHIAAAEAAARHRELMEGLGRAMARMKPEEQMIVRMHFGEGRTLAEVARVLKVEQKPLYRRIKQLRELLRGHLEREGVSGPGVRSVLEQEDS